MINFIGTPLGQSSSSQFIFLFKKGIVVFYIIAEHFNRPFLRETTKNGEAKMADMYETYIDGSYYIRVNRPASLRETNKNGKAKMAANMYETYIDGCYYIRVNYWQNSTFFCCL